ncbi:MAG: TAT-variant-translocated molybdopterin oxidoreductase [Acidobacteria bacterium]|nr:TAT-variant-translocated molybdopterin oxidoreductase [Acidobacteriota bacterium]
MSKHYWKSLAERDRDPAYVKSLADEFIEVPQLNDGDKSGVSRRSFLRAAGFAAAGGAFASCSPAPLKKAIPYLVQPEEITPGRAYWYASACGACTAGCGILTKNRDGRPIKLEGNPSHPLSKGGLCAVGQAAVLELYDSQRLKNPVSGGKESSWPVVDDAIRGQLERIKGSGGSVRFLTGSTGSLTARQLIAAFTASFADGKHVLYDALSASAILDAHEATHGARVLPRYLFDRADVIVSFDADFLGTWISPVEYTAGYAAKRALPALSHHTQIESCLSLTGSKADKRLRVAPSEIGLVLAHLANRLTEHDGLQALFTSLPPCPIDTADLNQIIDRLLSSRGKSLVVCGLNDVDAQYLINLINHALGNYGATIDVQHPSYQKQGNDKELYALIAQMESGKVDALFIHGVNPVYDLPDGARFAAALKKVGLVISFAERADETASLAHYICPDHHFLESWSDAEPVAGILTITQPAIRPLGATRSLAVCISAWMGFSRSDYELLRDAWRSSVFPRQTRETSYDAFWDKTVHDGHAAVDAVAVPVQAFRAESTPAVPTAKSANLALVLYPKVGLLDGRHAHNPWLQELPDPISKVTWDNYVNVSPALAQRLAVSDGDVLQVAAESVTIELPAHIQPGQHDSVISIALGYGRKGTDRFAKVGPQWLEGRPTVTDGGLVGKNAAPFRSFDGRSLQDWKPGVTVTKTGRRSELAATQTHHSLSVPERMRAANPEPRPMVQEATLAAYLKNPAAGAVHTEESATLWPGDHKYTGARWGMAIDLSACTGCGACVVGCQAENNVPVVGKDEVRRRREMHWIRIDRYYADRGEGDVDVVFQPMMCQQCGNAPCETVCPVLATVHSSEGLNQQVYNRCVGTRYCANNCPYKVRRFNWFDYPHEDRLQNMVLNPDVTIRSRGIMEKCTFCVQRIQEAKAEAKREGRTVKDGDVQPACAQSCPAKAIVFGNVNDPQSAVSRLKSDPRRYRVLAELNVDPSVGYMRVIRNREEEKE